MLRMTLVKPRAIILGKTLGTASSVLCVCTAAGLVRGPSLAGS